MNQNYTEYKFPQVKPHPWHKVFRPRTPTDAIDLVASFLRYTPESRLKPLEGCALPFFDELRDQSLQLPGSRAQSVNDLINGGKELLMPGQELR